MNDTPDPFSSEQPVEPTPELNPEPKPWPPRDMPREPMPKSFRPLWMLLGFLLLVTLLGGAAAAIVAILAR